MRVRRGKEDCLPDPRSVECEKELPQKDDKSYEEKQSNHHIPMAKFTEAQIIKLLPQEPLWRGHTPRQGEQNSNDGQMDCEVSFFVQGLAVYDRGKFLIDVIIIDMITHSQEG